MSVAKTTPEKRIPPPAKAKAKAEKTVIADSAEALDSAALAQAFKGALVEQLGTGNPEELETAATPEETALTQGEPAAETEVAESEPAPEPESETPEEEGETETEVEKTEEENEDEASKRKDWPETAVKRVGKLTARLHKLEEQVADYDEVVAERDALKAQVGNPAHAPVAERDSAEAQLEQSIAQKRAIIEWAEANPDGGEIDDGKGNSVPVTAQMARQAARAAQEDLLEQRLELKQYRRHIEAATQAATQAALVEYPWLADKTSPEYAQVQNALRAAPFLRKIPNYLQSLAELVEFQKVKAARKAAAEAKAKLNGAGVVKKPLVTARQPVRPNGAPLNAKAPPSINRFLETGSAEDAKETVLSWLS